MGGIICPPVDADAVPEVADDRYRIILVGYGPCGEIMSGILRQYDLEVVVLEMNIDTVNRLAKAGIPVLHGDARLRHILKLAGVEQAQGVAQFLTLSQFHIFSVAILTPQSFAKGRSSQ